MATPDFIRDLRRSAGHQLLWLPGVSAVVIDDRERVLLVRRADSGAWTVVGGIPEPGEEPALTAVREVYEETAVEVEVERVVSVGPTDVVEYPNGDRCQYMDICFRCRPVGGTARVNDDESSEVGWFAPDALPPLAGLQLDRIARARVADAPTRFGSPVSPRVSG
ncbi:NUDIX hydrolase [Streptomyces xiamenensis]